MDTFYSFYAVDHISGGLRTGTPISEHDFTITLATISLEDYMIWTRKLHHKIDKPFL